MRAQAAEMVGRSRQGTILIVVLVVLVMLTLAAYNYTQFMTTELEAAAMQAADAQARALADSGADYVAVLVANRGQPGYENLHDNPEMFLGIGVSDSPNARGRGRFTIISPVEHDTESAAVRYGLIDESGKLNLNTLSKLKLDDEQSLTLLMGLPGMTEYIADSMLDWIDTDDTIRLYGAESEYYENLSPPYEAKNGPLETLDELLLVQGVTPELLYGEDANRNGLLDPNENDGDASPPYDNADGYLQLGWNAFLTVYSRELNLRPDGTPRINLNDGMVSDVYDQLEAEFGTQVAEFVAAFRSAGPEQTSTGNGPTTGGATGTGGSGSGGSGGSGSGGSGGSKGSGGSGGSGGSSGSGGTKQQLEQQQQQLLMQAAGALGEALASGTGTVTRGRLDLTTGGSYQIQSVWELMGTKTAKVKGAGNTELPGITSPWSSPDEMTTFLDAVSLSGDQYIEGRININQARREVLIGLPGMTDTLADAIVARQQSDDYAQRTTTAWLLTEGLIEREDMVELDKFITARGDVYRAQILGFFDGGGPVARMEAVVDGTQLPPRVTFFRDLSDLGRGYTRTQLLPLEMR